MSDTATATATATAAAPAKARVLTKQDFTSDQEVRWCPACGDYVILAQVQRVLPLLGRPPEDYVFVSGIGCSSRFPYYMNTYGFHTIHGRAPTIATGIKCANPNLSVWQITGDGDGLSIGGNHLLHALRRNIEIKILLINNRIYGLTKGQYSPTSEKGKITKTSPMGSIEEPLNPLCFAIAARATFIARTYDTDLKHMADTLERAARHKGVAFVEILQNCKIFNDGIHEPLTGREVRSDQLVHLEHGKPLVFGKLRNKGIRMRGMDPQVVEIEPGKPPQDLLVHDEKWPTTSLAFLLTQLGPPDLPVAVGVFRDIDQPAYAQQLVAQIDAAKKKSPSATLHELFRHDAETWVIEPPKKKGAGVSGHLESVGKGELDDMAGADEDSYVADLKQDHIVIEGLERLIRVAPLSQVKAQSETIILAPGTSVKEALEKMRAGTALGTVLVRAADGSLSGILTERDFLMKLQDGADLARVTVAEVMTGNIETLHDDDTVACALNFMGGRGYRRVPVLAAAGPRVITIDDVLDFIRDA